MKEVHKQVVKALCQDTNGIMYEIEPEDNTGAGMKTSAE